MKLSAFFGWIHIYIEKKSLMCTIFAFKNILLYLWIIRTVWERKGAKKLHNVVITRSNLLTSSEKLNQWVKMIENIFTVSIVCTIQQIEVGLEIGCNVMQQIFRWPYFIINHFCWCSLSPKLWYGPESCTLVRENHSQLYLDGHRPAWNSKYWPSDEFVFGIQTPC